MKSDSTCISRHPESVSIIVLGAALKNRKRGHMWPKGGSEPTMLQGRDQGWGRTDRKNKK